VSTGYRLSFAAPVFLPHFGEVDNISV